MASNQNNSIVIPQHNQEVGANVLAERCFVLPKNASMKKGLVLATSPAISKAPYHHERNLHCECTRI